MPLNAGGAKLSGTERGVGGFQVVGIGMSDDVPGYGYFLSISMKLMQIYLSQCFFVLIDELDQTMNL